MPCGILAVRGPVIKQRYIWRDRQRAAHEADKLTEERSGDLSRLSSGALGSYPPSGYRSAGKWSAEIWTPPRQCKRAESAQNWCRRPLVQLTGSTYSSGSSSKASRSDAGHSRRAVAICLNPRWCLGSLWSIVGTPSIVGSESIICILTLPLSSERACLMTLLS